MDRFSSLPEGCISEIISFTSPRDACRLATISQAFELAAGSDMVWERFLPSDYREMVSRSLSPVVFPTKKQLFFALSQSPILLDDGNLSFNLDRESGKKCYMLGARSLAITWGNSPQYWNWMPLPESRFAEVAELFEVCWLEISGKMDTRLLTPRTTYVGYLVYNIAERNYGLDVFPAKASVRVVEGSLEDEGRVVYLKQALGEPQNGWLPEYRNDGLMEIELGEFFNDEGNNGGEVEMRLKGMEGYSWKSGLIVEGFELRPKVDN